MLKAKILFTNVVGAAIVFGAGRRKVPFFPAASAAAAVSAYIFCIKFTASDKTPKTRYICLSLSHTHIGHIALSVSVSFCMKYAKPRSTICVENLHNVCQLERVCRESGRGWGGGEGKKRV